MPAGVCVASASLRCARAFFPLFFSFSLPSFTYSTVVANSTLVVQTNPSLKALSAVSPSLGGPVFEIVFLPTFDPYCLAFCHSFLPLPASH
ncbi:hypothetical protein GGI42DRAFT_301855 [Trichoderma sp. SZMC 28013]